MTVPVRAVLADLDRTLTLPSLDLDPRVPPRIRALEAAGIPCIVVTGRPLTHVARVGLLGACRAVVAENGAIVCVPRLLLAEVADVGFQARAKAALGSLAARLQWMRVMGTGPLHLQEAAAAALDAARVAHGMSVNRDEFMLLPRGVDKGSGAGRALSLLGLTPKAGLAIGDGENDVALFHAVGRSAAVANAVPTAQAAAGIRLKRAYADGFLELTDGLLIEATL